MKITKSKLELPGKKSDGTAFREAVHAVLLDQLAF